MTASHLVIHCQGSDTTNGRLKMPGDTLVLKWMATFLAHHNKQHYADNLSDLQFNYISHKGT